jgi:hypothetical protein
MGKFMKALIEPETTLFPGAYSAQASSVSGGAGQALIEVYEVP